MFFISDRAMLEHYCPWDTYHIEVPERLETVLTTLEKSNFLSEVEQLKPRIATEDDIEMVHTKHYISEIKRTTNMDKKELEEFSSQYEDIYVNNNTFNSSMLAAGCVFELVDAVNRTGKPGFAAVRPPGHHAFPDRGCGFCIFNNVALAAKHALKQGHSRVLIVDWDVHAGQGTQECIGDDDRIRLVSIHRFQHGHFWPNLPQSAVQTKFKNTVNVPLDDVGMSDSDYLAIFQLIVHPIINDFKPDIILVSCGFDAALGDPEGEMRLTPAGYATLTRQLMSWGIPLAIILEGGYFMDSIAADFEWVMRALHGDAIPAVKIEPLNPALGPVINRVFKVFGTTYPTLALLETIKQRLKPTSDQDVDIAQEYEGTRDFTLPFPTRGLYSERSAATVAGFSEELRRIIATYKQLDTYKVS
ncbi:histone deacetylase family protein [Teladorsagia circumcincta]|uniref:Histone deacetylase family protein n=1 Tax=Teladorsagia circumcincta TaxID=45464 RepID=A0A2G9UWW3_TELCI|nr:histone deacetylase family protein [Teladorsagia circumcincta]